MILTKDNGENYLCVLVQFLSSEKYIKVVQWPKRSNTINSSLEGSRD